MNRLVSRLAFVPAAVLAFGSLLPITAADAAPCQVGTPFLFTASGATTSSSESQIWDTVTWGRTDIKIETASFGLHFSAYDENCVEICSHTKDCLVDYRGVISIDVHNGTGAYTLTATPRDMPGVTPPPPGECNVVNTAGVCANIATGNELERVGVAGVEVVSAGTHRVVGAIDTYRFPLPVGGSVLLPCVVLTVNNLGASDCELAGGTFENRFALLVDQSADQPSIGLTDPIVSVGLCDARVTVTASGFGVEDFPAVTVC